MDPAARPLHTALPWRTKSAPHPAFPACVVHVVESDARAAMATGEAWPRESDPAVAEEVAANFALIVRAVNNHHALVDLLERLAPALDTAAHLSALRGDHEEAALFRDDAAQARKAVAEARKP